MQMPDASQSHLHGPAWDLSSEYASVAAPAIASDLAQFAALLDQIEALNQHLLPHLANVSSLSVPEAGALIAAARQVFVLSEQASPLLRNVQTYASCLLSVDARDDGAQALQGGLQAPQKRYGECLQPLSQFLDLASDAVIDEYLRDPAVAASAFSVRHGRERRHELLGLAEENLAGGLALDGIHAWGDLYNQLSGTITCDVLVGNETQRLGLAAAAALMQQPDDGLRQQAWRGINAAWEQYEVACAAALNAIAGWRLEMTRKRSRERAVHFLDAPVHQNRIGRRTLDALLAAARATAPLARRAALAMARAYGKERIGPWDVRAPAPRLGPGESGYAFADAIRLIADACGAVAPEMGEFVQMASAKRWIEGTLAPRKRPGAYCTNFARSRTPRIYMTYSGTAADVITLAHELGHAYHSWVMRDLPDCQRSYGMSLAETASTFNETAVRDALRARAGDDGQRFSMLWADMESLVAFILNIPARFSFEQALYERRAERPLRPAELKTMMASAWQDWYGDCLCEPDPMFWASKLHFYISGLSFYNFPYLFGYLFSTGVYVRRADFGADFHRRYVALLRDTGRMTAESLAAAHLDVRLDSEDFWRDTVLRLEPRIGEFEAMVQRLVPGAMAPR